MLLGRSAEPHGSPETAKMLAESAMRLVLDDKPWTSGQATPATAMADTLVPRCRRPGSGSRRSV